MIEASCRSGIASEPFHEHRVPGLGIGQDLHGHGPMQDPVGSSIHEGHAARAEDLVQLVAAREHFGLGHVVGGTPVRAGRTRRSADGALGLSRLPLQRELDQAVDQTRIRQA